MKKFLVALALLSCTVVWAQESNREADSLRHEYGRQPVKSRTPRKGTSYADTLDTGNPAVKVVLYNDGTYRFVKDPSKIMADSVFTQNWNTHSLNPYKDKPENLSESFSIWVVDSLDSYVCPNITRPRSLFGSRKGRNHMGIDLPYPTGTPVKVAFDGKVRISGVFNGYGNLIVVRHASGLETFYAHLSQRNVEPGDWVSAGDIIGLGGSTGRSSGPHLHFETRYHGAAFDPAWLIDFETGTLRHRLVKIRPWYFNPNQRYIQDVDEEDEIFRTDEEERKIAAERAKKEAAARAAAEAAAMKYHTVVSGDTLYGLSVKYKTTVKEICRLNNIKDTSVLQIGQKLRVR